ncbi:hypothetical protein FF36_00356 [Frankia torreyi]|uniref:Uncharacterized protein n=1 Tax=Frankia torreyi TaxID=1856 RepID=A0A0D8BLY0_9ACTN|nr:MULTISPECIES: hypothetical protein [Frankia]KJE25223.1 hypothetical protein FF36_00356 [Frankia torreyi]KQC37749.1 hypothetical protein UK82_14155 [Frankia sp. ACN1ag]KQM07961.1 hypothetical protein FF86_1001217 [Frankia sp. CpI1-P]
MATPQERRTADEQARYADHRRARATILDAAEHLDPADLSLRARQLRDTAQAILRRPGVRAPAEAVAAD